MRVLLLGGSGFIGAELARALDAAGHSVTGFGRDAALAARLLPGFAWRCGDLRRMHAVEDWLPLLDGIDAVVNASGALQSGLRDDVDQVQYRAIAALVEAAGRRGLRQFVQISASNADAGADSPFMASKGAADAVLAASGLPHAILRPGLVIARNAFGGTELLRMAAALPGVAPDLRGTGPIQCVGMADLARAVLRALAAPEAAQGSFDLVEREGRPLGEVIALHRRWLGLGAARWRLPVPVGWLRPVCWLADGLGWLGWRSPLRSAAIDALVGGVTGEAAQAVALLGAEPEPLPVVLNRLGPAGKADRWQARSALVYPLALASLFVLWAGSGAIGLARLDEAAAILERGGIAGWLAPLLAGAAALVDVALALLVAWRRTARAALAGMAVVAAGYLAGSLWLLPGLWADPLAPMLKVLPVIALTLLCLAMGDER